MDGGCSSTGVILYLGLENDYRYYNVYMSACCVGFNGGHSTDNIIV